MFPSESDLTIRFAHVAYQLQQRFALRNLPIRNFGVTSRTRSMPGSASVNSPPTLPAVTQPLASGHACLSGCVGSNKTKSFLFRRILRFRG